MDSDQELLTRVNSKGNFFQSVVVDDASTDWNLAKDLGEFLVRTEPDSEVMGHALLVRACRHLNDVERAVEELRQCRVRLAGRELKPWERELFLPFLEEEERRLLDAPGTADH